MKYYSEDKVKDALQYAVSSFPFAAGHIKVKFSEWLEDRVSFTTTERGQVFTKAALLKLAESPAAKVKIHGLFGFLGKESATETELVEAAKASGFQGSTSLLLTQAKKKLENWQPGDVVRDAEGTYWKRAGSGKWAAFGTSLLWHDDGPKRPLIKVS